MSALVNALNQPWLITPDGMATVTEIVERLDRDELQARIAEREGVTPEAVAARIGKRMENTRAAVKRGPVCVIPIMGTIFRHANLMTEFSGGTTLADMATDFQAAMDDPQVSSVVFHIDSPGGESTGISDMAKLIRSAKKPTCAFVEGYGASAAYWIAAACSKVVTSDGGALGSIGVVMPVSTKKRTDRMDVTSKQSPKKRLDPTSESGQAQIQQMVDSLAQVFVESVADYRGVSVEHVLANFGQGGMLVGQKAVDAGLADSIGTLEGLISELGSVDTGFGFSRSAPMAVASVDSLEVPMKTQTSTGADASNPPVATDNAQAPVAGSDLAALMAKIQALETENASLKTGEKARETFKASFEAYVTGKAALLVPNIRETVVSALVQASIDDQANPIEGFSRSKVLQSIVEAGRPHQMTETLSGGDEPPVPEGFKVVHPAGDPPVAQQSEEERVAKLMSLTQLGRRAQAAH